MAIHSSLLFLPLFHLISVQVFITFLQSLSTPVNFIGSQPVLFLKISYNIFVCKKIFTKEDTEMKTQNQTMLSENTLTSRPTDIIAGFLYVPGF